MLEELCQVFLPLYLIVFSQWTSEPEHGTRLRLDWYECLIVCAPRKLWGLLWESLSGKNRCEHKWVFAFNLSDAGTLREREREPRLIHVISVFMSTNKYVQVMRPCLVSQPNQFLIWTCKLKTETDRVPEVIKMWVLQHSMWEFGDDYSIRIFLCMCGLNQRRGSQRFHHGIWCFAHYCDAQTIAISNQIILLCNWQSDITSIFI